jgi:DNA primase
VSFDRDLVLERTDLAALADELLGPHRGRGPSATWSCPDPGHGRQTGRTPPVSIFPSRNGIPRWHCHGCGVGGTAVDLVMVTQGCGVRDALALLAARAGLGEPSAPRPRRPGPAPRPAPPDLPPLRPAGAELAAYVDACAQHLRSPAGAHVRAWLAARRLPDVVLRANRVGADPGPNRLARAAGLPRRGPAVVLPVFTAAGEVAYLQARYLDPGRAGRKYDNPAGRVAPNPRVAHVHAPRASRRPGVLVVCEGVSDALTVAAVGYPALAVLGAGLPDAPLARRVAQLARGERIVVAFDADDRGQHGARRLRDLLTGLTRGPVGDLQPPGGDLNDWSRHASTRFAAELTAGVAAAAPTPALERTRGLAPSL